MSTPCILTDYLAAAMKSAAYEEFPDHTFGGRVTTCVGVVAFAPTLAECELELRSTLEDWVLLGLKLGHPLPVLENIDLNQEPVRESLESLQT